MALLPAHINPRYRGDEAFTMESTGDEGDEGPKELGNTKLVK
jgi:hypothetical protein